MTSPVTPDEDASLANTDSLSERLRDVADAADSGEDRVDGRTARALRTRAAVVDALLELIDEGDLRPTAPRIAERAGVSLRSVFQHFTDLDSLFVEAARRQFERMQPLIDERVAAEGALDDRIDAFVELRARLWERATPVRRAAQAMEPFSETLTALLQMGHDVYRSDTERVFAAEVADDESLLDALDAVTGWETWHTLRRLLRLDTGRAAKVVRRLIHALLDDG